MEERRKNEPVHCPVCRTLWPYHMPSPSGVGNYGLDFMPVSVPVNREGGGVSGTGSKNARISSSGNLILSQEKVELLEKLKEVSNISNPVYVHSPRLHDCIWYDMGRGIPNT